MRGRTWFRTISVLLCALLLAAALPAAAQAEISQRRVLFISSYSFSWGSVPFQIEGLSEGLGDGYVVNYEFMDTKNTVYSDGYREFYDLLKYKLSTRLPYDAVVACDDAALNFVECYKAELFYGIPIVFSGVDNVQNGIAAAKAEGETGIVEVVDYAANMQLAHALLPDAKKLVLILDNMENGIGIAEQLKASSAVFADYEVEYLNSSEYTRPEFIEKLCALNAQEIVFCISMGQSKDGTVYSEEERYELIRDYVQVPMFRFTQSGVGKGLLGGYIVDHRASCRIAGVMLRQMLEEGVEAEIDLNTPGTYYFDYSVMERYGIRLSRLPGEVRKNCILLNEPEGFLKTNVIPVVSVLCGLLVLILLIALVNRFLSTKRLSAKNRELALAVQAADSANQAKSQFLSRMSHDMRTPMNAILGITNLLKDRTDPVEIQADVAQIEKSGRFLLSLINDTLDMDKIEAGKLELHPQPINSEDLFGNVIATAMVLANQKGVQLKMELPPIPHGQWISVVADASRVEQIFMNLITNAVKFTPRGGCVTIHMETVAIEAETVTDKYVISDTGCGMSPEFIKRLYEPFSQEERVNTDRESGTGLGLTIVKRIIELMNGSIQVESRVGAGSTFTLVLSYPRYHGTLAHKPVKQVDLSVLKGRRVLLCEDHPVNAQIATRLLSNMGMIVDSAENGLIGVHKLADSPEGCYDVILMDIRMPVMNGLDAARAIRRLARADAKRAPIIALTANAYDSDIQSSLDAGMNAHLAKPVEAALLYRLVAEQIIARDAAGEGHENNASGGTYA